MVLLFLVFLFFIVFGISKHFFGQYINSLSLFIILLPWIIVNVLDVHSTLFGLKNSGQEKNPVGRWFIKKFGTKKGLVMGKFAIAVPITFLVLFLDEDAKNTIMALTIVVFLVVISNYCMGMISKYSENKNNQNTTAPNYPEG